jgi:hypothetical protein
MHYNKHEHAPAQVGRCNYPFYEIVTISGCLVKGAVTRHPVSRGKWQGKAQPLTFSKNNNAQQLTDPIIMPDVCLSLSLYGIEDDWVAEEAEESLKEWAVWGARRQLS